MLCRGSCQDNAEVQDLLTKGAVVRVGMVIGSYVSQIFLVEKKGGQRPVIDLKGLNNFVNAEHFKMEGLHTLPDLIQSQDWMVKLDLKDAYLQVPIHQDHHRFLQFQWEQERYQFVCLPFMRTSAPQVFTKIMKLVVGALRKMGICLMVYLDDIVILHQEREELVLLIPLTCQMFKALELVVNMGNHN